MTLNEFITKLAKTPRRWKLIENHALSDRTRWLLRGEDEHCPLRAVFPGVNPDTWYGPLAVKAGMAQRTVNQIMRAADSDGSPKLRARLLKACGL